MMMQAKTRFGEQGAEHPEGWTERCREATALAIDEHPLGTAFGVFAVGLSLGMLVGAALARPMPLQNKHVAESLGRRVLEAIQAYVPASVHHHLHG